MSRQILCLACGDKKELHPADKQMGFTFRKCYVSLNRVPDPSHGIAITSDAGYSFTPLKEYKCDLCGETISGEIVVASSYIPPGREMGAWEEEYGRVMTDEEVAAYRKLSA